MELPYFTYAKYIDILKSIKSFGHHIGTFQEYKGIGPYVILRHDIDYSLVKAKKIALLDQSLSIKSSFFVLLTSPYYNALSRDNRNMIRDISRMGHEVGLHYDCSDIHNLSSEEYEATIVQWAMVLQDITGQEVRTIAQHKPSETDMSIHSDRFLDAYSPEFCRDMAYLRDSAMTFGNVRLREVFSENDLVQLLIHPIWWHSTLMSRTAVFKFIACGISENIYQLLEAEEKSILEWEARQHLNYTPWQRPQYR